MALCERLRIGYIDHIVAINKYKEISILYQQSSIESFTHVVPHYWHFFSLDDILATDWEEVEE